MHNLLEFCQDLFIHSLIQEHFSNPTDDIIDHRLIDGPLKHINTSVSCQG